MKKCIAFLTTALLIIQTFVFTVAPVSAASYRFTDGETILNQMNLGLPDLEEPKMDYDSITRAEFIKILMNVMGMPDVAGVVFTDANAHDYYGALAAASQMGIITGTEARPDDAARYNEVLTMLVRALGYEDYAVAKGGYPIGYLDIARRYGFTTGVSIQGEEDITYGDAIALLYNAMNIEILKVAIYTGSYIQYQVSEGETMLSAYQGLQRKEGLVKGTPKANMVNATIPEGFIRIESANYNTTVSNPEDYVGLFVEFYCNEDTNTVAAIVEKENTVLKLSSSDILSLNVDSLTLKYEDKEDELCEEKLSMAATILYNNVPIDSFDPTLFTDSEGSFTFIDNDGDEKFDVVFMVITEEFVVQAIDAYNEVVYDAYGRSPLNLKEEGGVEVEFINELGDEMTLAEVRAGDVISVMRSLDGSRVSAVYSNTEVHGQVDSFVDEEGNRSITINGETYPALESFFDNNEISIGDGGAFRLTTSGYVAALNRSGGTGRDYSFLIGIAKSGNSMNTVYSVKMLNQDSNYEVLEFAKKITLDGQRVSAETVYEFFYDSVNEKTRAQLVRLGKNAVGLVNWIDTVAFNPDYENRDNSLYMYWSSFVDQDGAEREEVKKQRYNGGSYKFEGVHPVTVDARMFLVPEDLTNVTDEQCYVQGVEEYMGNSSRNSQYYAMEMFSVGKEGKIPDVVIYRPETSSANINLSETAYFVEKVTKAADGEGNQVTKVEAMEFSSTSDDKVYFYIADQGLTDTLYWIGSNSVVYDNVDDGILHKLSVGDIVQIQKEFDSDNIKNIRVLYNGTTQEFAYADGTSRTSRAHMENSRRNNLGEVYEVLEGQVIRIHYKGFITTPVNLVDPLGDNMEVFNLAGFRLFKYDSEEKVLSRASVNDFVGLKQDGEQGTRFFMTSANYGRWSSIVILH